VRGSASARLDERRQEVVRALGKPPNRSGRRGGIHGVTKCREASGRDPPLRRGSDVAQRHLRIAAELQADMAARLSGHQAKPGGHRQEPPRASGRRRSAGDVRSVPVRLQATRGAGRDGRRGLHGASRGAGRRLIGYLSTWVRVGDETAAAAGVLNLVDAGTGRAVGGGRLRSTRSAHRLRPVTARVRTGEHASGASPPSGTGPMPRIQLTLPAHLGRRSRGGSDACAVSGRTGPLGLGQ